MNKYNVGDKLFFEYISKLLPCVVLKVIEQPYDYNDVFMNRNVGTRYVYRISYELKEEDKVFPQECSILQCNLYKNEKDYWEQKAKSDLPKLEIELKELEIELKKIKENMDFLRKFLTN